MAFGDILTAEETVLLASTYLVGANAGPGADEACLEVRAPAPQVPTTARACEHSGSPALLSLSIRTDCCI